MAVENSTTGKNDKHGKTRKARKTSKTSKTSKTGRSLNPLPHLVQSLRLTRIQVIITVSFTAFTILVMIVVGLALYNKFSQTAQKNAFLNNQQIIEQVNYNLDYYVKGMTEIFELTDDKIRAGTQLQGPLLYNQLDTIRGTRKDIVSITVFTKKGDMVATIPQRATMKNSKLTEQGWFLAATENPDQLYISPPHIENLFKGGYKWVVSMSRNTAFMQNGKPKTGVLLVDVNFKTIDDLCRRVSLGKKGYVYIVDSAGNIVYHPQQQLIYVALKYENLETALKYSYGSYIDHSNGAERLITIKTVNKIGWKIVGVSYMDEVVTTRKELSSYFIWLLVLIIPSILLISAYMSARISQPIKRLERSMKLVEQGDFDISLQVKGAYEVEQLSKRFNIMLSRIRQLMDQIIYEQEAKRKSELDVLQAQINPHFLYNTLNSVIRMVGVGKTEEVITTISSLSKFFRISLSRGKNVITVQEELEHVRNYLIIQKIRYKNRFDYEIAAEEEALHCKCLKLILQPLVENAIYHGIEMMADKGEIRITASVVGDKVLFEVRDNGLGIPPQQLEQILLGHTRSENGSGVGVKNVHERIRLYYGEGYGLEFESQLEEGTTVKVWIARVADERVEGAK